MLIYGIEMWVLMSWGTSRNGRHSLDALELKICDWLSSSPALPPSSPFSTETLIETLHGLLCNVFDLWVHTFSECWPTGGILDSLGASNMFRIWTYRDHLERYVQDFWTILSKIGATNVGWWPPLYITNKGHRPTLARLAQVCDSHVS